MIGDIDVRGLSELEQRIADIDKKMRDRMLSKALNQGLNPMRKAAIGGYRTRTAHHDR